MLALLPTVTYLGFEVGTAQSRDSVLRDYLLYSTTYSSLPQ